MIEGFDDPWLEALRSGGADFLVWLDESQSAALLAGGDDPDATHEEWAALNPLGNIGMHLPVAALRQLEGATLWTNVEHEGQLFLCPQPQVPEELWVDVGPDLASIRAAIGVFVEPGALEGLDEMLKAILEALREARRDPAHHAEAALSLFERSDWSPAVQAMLAANTATAQSLATAAAGACAEDASSDERRLSLAQRAADLRPDCARAAANLGMLLTRAREHGRAIAAYSRALELEDFSLWGSGPTCLYNRACEYAITGDVDAALADLVRAGRRSRAWLTRARADDYFDAMRDDPRFVALLEDGPDGKWVGPLRKLGPELLEVERGGVQGREIAGHVLDLLMGNTGLPGDIDPRVADRAPRLARLITRSDARSRALPLLTLVQTEERSLASVLRDIDAIAHEKFAAD